MSAVSEPTDLFGVPLEDFTAERNALGRRLREEGKPEQAADVARLRKPTTDAWALNQVARADPDRVERLIDTHRAMREAEAVDVLRQASETRRRLIDEIVEAAAAVLERSGHSAADSVRIRMARTLLASAGDADAERSLAQGTLERPIEIPDDWPAIPFVTPDVPDGRQDELAELETRERELAARAEELQRLAERARDELTEARRRAQEITNAAREAAKAASDARKEAEALRGRRS